MATDVAGVLVHRWSTDSQISPVPSNSQALGMRTFRLLPIGVFVGTFDELAGLEYGAGVDEARDTVHSPRASGPDGGRRSPHRTTHGRPKARSSAGQVYVSLVFTDADRPVEAPRNWPSTNTSVIFGVLRPPRRQDRRRGNRHVHRCRGRSGDVYRGGDLDRTGRGQHLPRMMRAVAHHNRRPASSRSTANRAMLYSSTFA